MEPVTFIKEVGFYAATVAAVAWFVKRDVWPFCMKQIEQRYSDQQERHMRMFGLLETLSEQVTAQRAQSIEALHVLAQQMTALASTVNAVAQAVHDLQTRVEFHHPATPREREPHRPRQ